MAKLQAALCVFLVAAFGCATFTSAERHIVGGEKGWDYQENNPTFYEDWANGRKFRVGDTLVFNFQVAAATLVVVDEVGYDNCAQYDHVGEKKEHHYHSPVIFELKKPEDYYFISSVGRQCEAGTKLHVKALARDK